MAHLLDLAELLVDAIIVVLDVHGCGEDLALELCGKAVEAPVLQTIATRHMKHIAKKKLKPCRL